MQDSRLPPRVSFGLASSPTKLLSNPLREQRSLLPTAHVLVNSLVRGKGFEPLAFPTSRERSTN